MGNKNHQQTAKKSDECRKITYLPIVHQYICRCFFSKPFKGVFVGGCSIRWCITESTVNSNQHQQLAPTGHQTDLHHYQQHQQQQQQKRHLLLLLLLVYYFYYYHYYHWIYFVTTIIYYSTTKFYSKPHLAWRLDLWHPARQIQKQRQNHGFKWMVDRDSRYSSHPNGESSEMVTLSFQLSRFWFWFGDWSSRNMVHDFARSGAGSLVG